MSQSTSLRSLEQHDAFIARHIGPNDAEIAQMLEAVARTALGVVDTEPSHHCAS
ncbi:hypothetical protein [Luteimonas salinilitoris]|uniref:Glycine dehydrogenase (aminomethyl-transferring) n=1 Tax=Luteimonas salinilitoris TaxID=3237697 RepID=A0ABV4HKC3_9GAMM